MQQAIAAEPTVKHPAARLNQVADKQQINARAGAGIMVRGSHSEAFRARGGAQKSACGGKQLRLFQQEGVMAFVSVDLDE